MKKISLFIFIGIALFALVNASVWEGTAVMSGGGELPSTGLYMATNSYPGNTIVDVTNLETGKTVRVVVSSALDNPALLAMLSKDAANAIGIAPGAISRVSMTQPDDPIAFSRFTEGRAAAGDPDFDPSAFVTMNSFDLSELEESDAAAPEEAGAERLESGDLIVDLATAPVVPVVAAAPEPVAPAIDEPTPVTPPVESEPVIPAPVVAAVPEPAVPAVDEPAPVVPPAEPEPVVPAPVVAAAPEPVAPVVDEPAPVTPPAEPEPVVPAPVIAAVPEPAAPVVDEPAPITPPAEPEPVVPAPVIAAIPEPVAPVVDEPAPVTPPVSEPEPVAPAPVVAEPSAPVAPVMGSDIHELTLVPAGTRPPEEEPGPDPADFIDPIETAAPFAPAVPPPPVVLDSSRFIEPVAVLPPAEPPSALPPAESPAVLPPSPKSAFSAPMISSLEKGRYYLQIAAFTREETVRSEIGKLDSGLPVAVMNAGSAEKPVYRILIGPVNLGESGALLQRFKGTHKDAFVRLGTY